MSAISNAGTSSSLIYLAVQSTRSASCDDPSMDATDGQSAAAGGTSAASGSTAQQSPLGDLRSQIETAVTDSLSKLPAGSSPEDVFKAVRSAVEDTLKANGIDPQQVAGHHGGHHHHHAGGAPSGGAAAADAASSSDPDGDGDDQQAATDPLLAALQSTSDNPADPLTTSNAAGATGSPANSQSTTALAFFATGPNAADALATLVQQISGTANSQNGQSSGQSKSGSSLLSALQSTSTSNLNLNDIFKQLFQSFPSGTGLDVQV